MGLEDEAKGVVRVAMVMFEEVCQRLAFFERDEGQEDIAGECKIERGVGFAMAVAVFLPGAGVAFVVVAVFHRPVLANRIGSACFFLCGKAGEEEAGVAFGRLERVFLLRPIALDGDGRAGARQSGVDGGDGGDGPATQVQTPVLALLAQSKKGVALRACVAPARRWEVFSLVPMR
jgi:hypothetical protein